MEIISIEIRDPLPGNYVYVNEGFLNRAIRAGAHVMIKTPLGSLIVSPRDWKRNGKKIKKVFKFKDNPMTLYGGRIPIEGEKEVIKKEEPKPKINQGGLFS